MGSDGRLYLRLDEARAEETQRVLTSQRVAAERRGEWLSLTPAEDGLAEELSRRLGGTTVHLDLHTVVDQIWIRCFDGGALSRELRYTADEKWAVKKGKARPFENVKRMKEWLSRRDLVASPDGYAVLESFLGFDCDAPRPKPVEPIIDRDGTSKLQLAPALVAELREAAERSGTTASELLHEAWERAKHALYEREAARAEPRQLVSLQPSALPPLGARRPRALPKLALTGFPIACQLRLPPQMASELVSMKSGFDRSAAWLVTEAYLLARQHEG